MKTARDTREEQLATAIVFGHVDQVRDLIKAGADITANEHKAVHLAARHGRADILHVLLDAGGQLYHTGGHDLEAAIQRDFPVVVLMMLRRRQPSASLLEKALRTAVEYNRRAMVTWLREAGARLPLGRRAAWLANFDRVHTDVQVALLASGGPARSQSIVALTQKGLAQEAILSALGRRQDGKALAAVLQATRALEDLSPAERADLLEDMLNRSPHRARQASAVAAPR